MGHYVLVSLTTGKLQKLYTRFCIFFKILDWTIIVKGVLHPRPVFGLFMHFSQKLQHIGNKYGIFLIGNIPGNLVTALEFH